MAEMGKVEQYWHGGAPGREVGEYLLPPDHTGLKFTRREVSAEEGVTTPITQRRDRVYVTTRRELAKTFASEWSLDGVTSGGGWLYLVSVEPEILEPDADMPSLGFSFQCRRARVERIWERDVKSTPALSAKVLNGVLAEIDTVNRQRRDEQAG